MAIDYIAPLSWHDKGMNWDNPDPANMDYWVALKMAIRERIETIYIAPPARSDISTPYEDLYGQNISIREIVSIRETIYYVAGYFVDADAGIDAWLSGTQKVNASTLMDHEDSRIFELPLRASTLHDGHLVQFLRNARNFLNRLTIPAPDKFSGTVHVKRKYRSGDLRLSSSSYGALASSLTQSVDKLPTRMLSTQDYDQEFGTGLEVYNATGCSSSGSSYYSDSSSQAYEVTCDHVLQEYGACRLHSVWLFMARGFSIQPNTMSISRRDIDTAYLGFGLGEGAIFDHGLISDGQSIALGDCNYVPKYPQGQDGNVFPATASLLYFSAKVSLLCDFGVPGGFRFIADT